MAAAPPPLAACAAILRFIDSGSDAIDGKSQILRSDNGTSTGRAELQRQLEELRNLDATSEPKDDGTSEDQNLQRKDSHRETEVNALRVYDKCKPLADKLEKVLQANGQRKQGSGGGDLDKWKRDANALKAECAATLRNLLNDRQSSEIKQLDELRQRDASMEANVSQLFEKLRLELMSALSRKSNDPKQSRPLSIILGEMVKEAQYARLAQDILLGLRFDGMRSRMQSIARTHGDTYEWIFSSPQKIRRQKGVNANFTEWAENDADIFWITGEPGSGKSTLMKFVDNHDTTRSKLQTWAKGYKLVKASHYFSVNGSTLQKSQLGLLRALCFDILRQCPDLLPQLCADRWQEGMSQREQPSWQISELESILHRLQASEFKVTNEKVRFCFFIDGLDEYSGDYEGLLNNLRHLASSPHIKICAASRPWKLFEEALGRDDTRMLTMQHLTVDDISMYARDVLEADEHFTALEKEDSKASDLIDDIIAKANGVFLWVYLVVKQVQSKLQDGSSFEELEKSVSEFPSDLDDYFRHMLDNLDNFKQQETAQIFRICIRARQPLALLAFAVLDPDNPVTKALEGSGPVAREDVETLRSKMEDQILTRGPDLLNVIRDGGYVHVEFTHRTVRDFMTHGNMDALFAERAGKDFGTGEEFDPLVTLCHMSVLSLARLDLITASGARNEHYYALVHDCLSYALDLERASSTAPFRELDRLEQILKTDNAVAKSLDTNTASPLLPLAVRGGLQVYVKHRLTEDPGAMQSGLKYPERPLLSFALPVFRLREGKPCEFHPEMVSVLLAKGGDANVESWMRDDEAKVDRKGSVWSLYLRALYSMHKHSKSTPEGAQPLLVTEMLIEGGANYVPSCLTEDGSKGEREILEYAFGKAEASRLVNARGVSNQAVKSPRTSSSSGTSRRPSWARAKSSFRKLSMSGNSDTAVT